MVTLTGQPFANYQILHLGYLYLTYTFYLKLVKDAFQIRVNAVNNGELVPSARSNCTTLPKQEYRLAGWLYRSATALCQRCEPLFR